MEDIVVQTHRFAILEGFGCIQIMHTSVPSLFIAQVPLVLLAGAALVYAGVALRWLIHRRAQFLQASQHRQLVQSSSRYLRLVVLAVTQMAFATIMTVFLLGVTIHYGFYPWTSWKDVHKHWREIALRPKDSLPESYWTVHMISWYFIPLGSVIVFANFGFDDRVAAEYRGGFAWVKERVLGMKAEEFVILPLRADHTVITQNGQEVGNAAADEARTDGRPHSNPPSLATAA